MKTLRTLAIPGFALCHLGWALGVAVALTLGACATPANPPYAAGPAVESPNAPRWEYGVVQSIELVKAEPHGIAGSGIGVGAVAGAVVGGLAGSQVGGGKGKVAATVLGAAGGAYVGNEIENRQRQADDAYRITVRMDDGSRQSLTQDTETNLRVGDRVRVGDGVVQRY